MYFVFLGLFNYIPATWKSLLESTAERFDALTILQGSELNPRKYKRTYTTAPVQGGRRGWLEPLPWVFAVLQYLGNISPLIDSLSCELQDKVNIMGCGAAGCP